jgi:hypothetical protein
MHSQDKAMLIAFYDLGTEIVMHSLDKTMLVALLSSRNCGSHAFTGESYVSCPVMFKELS